MNSIAPLLWAIVFLALTIGVFSIVFLQGRFGFLCTQVFADVWLHRPAEKVEPLSLSWDDRCCSCMLSQS